MDQQEKLVYLNVHPVEVQVIQCVMASGLSHLTQVTNIPLDLSVIGLPTLNVQLIVITLTNLMSLNAASMSIVINVMEVTALSSSSVSTLDLVIVNKIQIVTTGMELAMYLLPMTLTTVPTVLRKELALEDVEVLTMT